MLTNRVKRVYFLGIGGIGMSALARFFRSKGVAVAGYDRTETPLTRALADEGMDIHYEDDPRLIPMAFLNNPSEPETLIVYTPAIPKEHREQEYFLAKGYQLHKRSEILGLITNAYRTVAVAGTHGKSSVSAILTQILLETDQGCNAFLGAISKSLGSNLALSAESDLAVAEADEFDRSFLTLNPTWAVVTSIDPDHLDIYGDYQNLQEGFRSFLNRVRENSDILIKLSLSLVPDPGRNLIVHTYSLDDPRADFYARNIEQEGLGYRFELVRPGEVIHRLQTRVPGITNVENAVAAASVASLVGAGHQAIRNGLLAFEGLVRRFDLRFNRSGVTYIDDYAHHPAEIRALIQSIRMLFPGRKISGIFQPHLYTRTRDLADGFARELSELDELILLDIYPAREKPIPGVDSDLIFNQTNAPVMLKMSKQELPDALSRIDPDVLLTIGAGDIDQLVGPITEYLNRYVA
ncbi:MAG: UDP-N-acetylmuramate--L-alanine ligase [Bacteroidales bacterium]